MANAAGRFSSYVYICMRLACVYTSVRPDRKTGSLKEINMFNEKQEKEIMAMLERIGRVDSKSPMYIQADQVWSASIDKIVTDEFRDYYLQKHYEEIVSSEPGFPEE